MENTDSKIPVIMEEKRSGVAGRFVGLLAGGVVLLAVAVIVLIACGTYVIQQQNECEATATSMAPRNEKAEEYDHATHTDRSDLNEHSIVYPESRREFSVSRDFETGYVTGVIFLDYIKGITAIYEANDHKCYLYDGTGGDFGKESNQTVSYMIGENIENSSDLPTEFAPFCTTSNSYWMYRPEQRSGDVQKRSDLYCCCIEHCVYIYLHHRHVYNCVHNCHLLNTCYICDICYYGYC